MADSWDNLRDDTDPSSPPARRPAQTQARLIVAAVALLAAGVAAYLIWGRSQETPAPTTEQAAAAPPAPAQPLGADPFDVDVPPLAESDDVVHMLVRQLSTHPQVAAWLATDGLIRNFTVVVANIAEGNTPAPVLGVFRPGASFQVIEQEEDLVIDPRSYRRYDAMAAAVDSVDAGGAARLYATLKPRIGEAYAQLGQPDTFDATLEQALVRLVATPIPSGPVAVEPRGIGYAYADRSLEKLTAAQKQLLRMGPDNARLVQDKLREIALALGIPSERLAAAR